MRNADECLRVVESAFSNGQIGGGRAESVLLEERHSAKLVCLGHGQLYVASTDLAHRHMYTVPVILGLGRKTRQAQRERPRIGARGALSERRIDAGWFLSSRAWQLESSAPPYSRLWASLTLAPLHWSAVPEAFGAHARAVVVPPF